MNIKDIRDNFTFRVQCESLGVDYRNSLAFKNVVFVFKPELNAYVVLDEAFNCIGTDVLHAEEPKFKAICSAFGLDNYNFYIFGDVIAVESPVKNLYVLADKSYNVFGVAKCKEENLKTMCANLYNSYIDESVLLKAPMSRILMVFTFENVLNISQRVREIKYAEKDKRVMSINIDGNIFLVSSDNMKAQLLCLIKYLGECTSFFFNQSYSLMAMHMISNSPDVQEYLQKVVSLVSKTVLEEDFDVRIHLNKLISQLGQMTKREEFRVLLEGTSNFLNECHKVGRSSSAKLSRDDLKFTVNQVLRLADCSNEDTWKEPSEILNDERDFDSFFAGLSLINGKKYSMDMIPQSGQLS